jgi:hypothetical protein
MLARSDTARQPFIARADWANRRMNEALLSVSGPAGNRWGPLLAKDLFAAIPFLVVGIGLVLHPYASGREMPGDLADGRFIFSLLEFFYSTLLAALHGRPVSFVEAPFFFPWPRVTNFSETFWGSAGIYALIRAFGVSPLASFQAWFVTGFALTYVTAFVSLRMLGLRTWGAVAGAFLFTFCLPMAGQFNHAQLVYRLWVPPALLALDRFLTRGSLRAGAACVMFVALQLAASIYLGLFLCLLLAAYGMAVWFLARNRLRPRLWATFRSASVAEFVTAGSLLVAGLVVIAIVGIPYYQVQSMYGFTRSWEDIIAIPRPGSYVLVAYSKLWPDLSARFPYPFVWEHRMFPGLSAIIPFAWFLVSKPARASQPLAAPMLAAVAILFLISIDLGGHTIWRLIYLIPGFSVLRAVPRIIIVMMLPLAALLGMLIDDLTAALTYRFARCLFAVALLVFLVAECSLINQYSSSPSDWRARLDAVKAHLPEKLPPNAVLAIATEPLKPGIDWSWMLAQADADVAAVTLGIATLNGYSGNWPPTWKSMTTCRDIGENLRAARHFLAEHGLPPRDVTPDRLVLVGFGDCDPAELVSTPFLQLGRTYHFAEGSDGNQFLGGGFSYPESWGRWTNGKDAFLFFTLVTAPMAAVSIRIEASSFSASADRKQVVEVVANGHFCSELVVTASQPQAKLTCPPGVLQAGSNMLHLRISRPTRPIDVGINDADDRQLGLGLQSLALEPEE